MPWKKSLRQLKTKERQNQTKEKQQLQKRPITNFPKTKPLCKENPHPTPFIKTLFLAGIQWQVTFYKLWMTKLNLFICISIFKVFVIVGLVLTNEIECLLEILFDILMGRIAGRYLHILQSLQVTLAGTLAGNIKDTISTHTAGIVRIASVAQQ